MKKMMTMILLIVTVLLWGYVYSQQLFRIDVIKKNKNDLESKMIEEISGSVKVLKDYSQSEVAEIAEIKRYSCIDYELLESKYEILNYDICTEPNYEWKDRKLEEFVLESYADILEQEKQLIETGTSEGDIVPTTFDYHIFDFNDDGLDDFLLCIYGWAYLGSAGHGVKIIIQEEEGKYRSAGDFILRLGSSYSVDRHSGLAVLEEKNNGFYALVVSEYSRILRYDQETGCYKFTEEAYK